MGVRLFLTTALAVAVLAAPAALPPGAYADDDNDTVTPAEGIDPTFDEGQVDGFVYSIAELEGAQVVTVLDRDVGAHGLSIRIYVREPGLVALVKNGTVCVGRYIIADGIRTSPSTLDAHGITVDASTACGTPPGTR